MMPDDFVKLADARFDACSDTLSAKSKEYSRANDKLHNFKKAGLLLGCTPEKALAGMWIKHIVSLLDIVDDIEDGDLPTLDLVAEKIGDSINYAILLEALIMERFDRSIA